MNNVLYSHYREGSGPAREQNLFIGLSKHLYLLKDGTLKYQSKEIDPRVPGTKKLLTRFVLLDVDTGTLYGEYHDEVSAKDLLGFMARAWSTKANNPIQGFPQKLNLPRIAVTDSSYAGDIQFIKEYATELVLGDLPSGFSAGVHAVKQFEREMVSLIYDCLSRNMDSPDLFMVKACSGVISAKASNSMSHSWSEKWKLVKPVPSTFIEAVDSMYGSPGAWRKGAFEMVLNGSSKKTKSST